MCEIKKVKAKEIFCVIQELLSHGGKAWITVTGMSMYPFLREDLDCVELAGTNFEAIKKGDIVLIQRKSGQYVLHRVLRKKKDVFYIIGDAQRWIEGPLSSEQLLARVESVKRSGRIINCTSTVWRLMSRTWLEVIPIRHFILIGIRWLSKKNRYIRKLCEG